MSNEHIWTPSGTDITLRWRLNGWVPPSEMPEYQLKWRRYQELSTRKLEDKARQEFELVLKRNKIARLR